MADHAGADVGDDNPSNSARVLEVLAARVGRFEGTSASIVLLYCLNCYAAARRRLLKSMGCVHQISLFAHAVNSAKDHAHNSQCSEQDCLKPG